MCAIAGVIGMIIDHEISDQMINTMKRRGPDGQGLYIQDSVMLLHTRLAIIDPVGGTQPMRVQLGREVYMITYNGELYNTEEIRRELISLGHHFETRSDTEVILRAYVQWKESCLDKLNGIYAFAIWEEHSKKLFLARDRMGVKPFFYRQKEGGLIFASELKTILSHPQVEAELDAEGAGEVLLLGPGRTPGSGVFRGIQELEPGCYGIFQNGKLSIRQYWNLTDREHGESLDETLEIVRYLVLDSIRRQMVSDVPIGTFLSGGLDSSLISSVCASSMDEKLKTFSVDYEGQEGFFVPGKFQPSYDSYYIEVMKNYLNTDHTWSVLGADALLGALEDATRARDLPGMADVDFSLLLFCGQIRQFVKVALSGECADEIFGGYPWYRDPEVRMLDGFPWAQNNAQRISLLHPQLKLNDPYGFIKERYQRTVNQSDILPGNSPQERRMKEMVNLNYRWFMQTLLDRKDRMSMYHGLEVRVPFCDHRIAQYLYGVPWEMKDLGGKEKGLLRKAIEGFLPQEVLWRKKSPYPKTFDPLYETLVKGRVEELLLDRQAPVFQLVSREGIRQLIEEDHPWPWYGQLMRKPQTLAFILQIDFWLREYHIRLV